jgi:peptidoglycan hydrolase-like protein with peptidoglycan-binding domain
MAPKVAPSPQPAPAPGPPPAQPNKAPTAPATAPPSPTKGTYAPTNITVADVLAGRAPLVPKSRGDAVKKIQGFLGIGPTGVLGPTTAKAIVAFKKEQGIATPPGEDPATIGPTTLKVFLQAFGTAPSDLTPHARRQMSGLLAQAKAGNDGGTEHCYEYVWRYMTNSASGYGNGKLSTAPIPGSFAAQFGEWLNVGNNAASVGLKRLDVSNPYDAPAGAVVVVAAGSPGTTTHASHDSQAYADDNNVTLADYEAHPNWPGDISVATGDGTNFINDHANESYGGRDGWNTAAKAGTAKLIGVYVPI